MNCQHCDEDTRTVRGMGRVSRRPVWICELCRAPKQRPSLTKARRAPRSNNNRRK